ncbi:MAG TPA: DUF4249 family protein [Saprospiraceae bacterium]|nr:DUF4249 family protein [Saprospiraceae bacterium]
MKKITTSFLLFTFMLLIHGCTQQETSEFTDWAIIETYIQPGDYLNVKVTRQLPFSSDVEYAADDINNLSITVTSDNIVYNLTPLGDGIYIDSSLIVAENAEYTLSFLFNSQVVSAYTYIPSKPRNFKQSVTSIYVTRIDSTSGFPTGGFSMPDPVELTWDNPDHDYYLAIVENVETTLDPIRDFGDNDPPSNIFRKSPTTAAATEIRSQEFQYFGTHRIILYHVLPDYAALYNESTTSSQNLTNPSTSITNGYGIFTGLNADTLFIEVRED